MVEFDSREYTTPSPEDEVEERSTFQQQIAPCEPPSPPDGGVRALLVMFASFINTGVVFGVITGNSLIIAAIQSNLASNNDADASSKAALVGSLCLGTLLGLSPIGGIISDFLGTRIAVLFGGLICVSGMSISSFFSNNVAILWVTYGFMFGLGASFCYSPSLVILGKYFKRHLSKATGFVEMGAPVFGIIVSEILSYLLANNGISSALKALAILSVLPIITSLAYKKDVAMPSPKAKKRFFNTNIWRNKRYVIWNLCCMCGQLGFYAPFAHIVKFSDINYPSQNSNMAIICISLGSVFGRIIAGCIGDSGKIQRITFQQILTILFGLAILVIAVPDIPYYLFLTMTTCFGMLDGAVIALNTPIAIEICGIENANQALGFLFGLMAGPLIIGPPLVGKIYDTTGTYTEGFLMSAAFIIIGGLSMFFIRLVKERRPQDDEDSPLLRNREEDSKRSAYETLVC